MSRRARLVLQPLCSALLLIAAFGRAARAGDGFTIFATEENTRDMSVNLGADALRGGTTFDGRVIQAPSSVAGRDEMLARLNHDDGVLDVQHTLFVNAALSSRILIHFQTLRRELENHCWTKEEATSLTATLRLRVIPPYGPSTHYRLWGIAPTLHTPPLLDIDPPPASVPIGVFRQTAPWIEGPGQNSFFTASYGDDLLLDVKTVGVATAGIWHGVAVAPVDVCVNRVPGLVATSWVGDTLPLCFDPSPASEPWVEWDVSAAVGFWLEREFDPSVDHGFSLYQYPGRSAADQIRLNTPVVGFGRSRAVVSFASSSGAADCAGAGGEWGGPGGVDLVYANTVCMTPARDDLEPGNPYGAPRFVAPVVRPEWAPQLVVRSVNGAGSCVLSATAASRALDVRLGETAQTEIVLRNRTTDRTLAVDGISVSGSGADAFRVTDACRATPLPPGGDCAETLTLAAGTLGKRTALVTVQFRIEGEAETRTQSIAVTGTVSEDGDGIPDDVENLAPSDGDGDGDGVPDRRQDHVGSLANSGGAVVTLKAPPATRLAGLQQVELTPPEELRNVRFENGFYAFTIEAVDAGSAVDLDIFLPGPGASVYHAFGPTAADPQPHWYTFPFDGTAGAAFDGGRMSLRLVDGGAGDHDLVADGRIMTAGGAGTPGFSGIDARVTNAEVGCFCALDGRRADASVFLVWVAAFVMARTRTGRRSQ